MQPVRVGLNRDRLLPFQTSKAQRCLIHFSPVPKKKQTQSEFAQVLPGVEIKGEPSAIAPHLGKWVAIVDGTIRASGRNFGEAFDAANAQGLNDAEFVFLPRHAFVG